MSDLDESDPEIEDKEDSDKDETVVKSSITKKKSSKYVEPIKDDNEEGTDEDIDISGDEDDDDDDLDDNSEVESEDIEQSEKAKTMEKGAATSINFPEEYGGTYNEELISPINSDVESDDEDYLQKFDSELRDNYIDKIHPECLIKNYIEVESLTKITRDKLGNIIDDNHKTLPILSKYERTRILGQRANQINTGDKPYVDVPPNIIDGYLIAQLELQEKKIPIIIRRPLPGGKSEYWKLEDLELL